MTITLNNASTGIGSGIAGGTGGVTLTNTIVAQNPGQGTEQNLAGSILSDDFNLIGDADNGVLTGATVNTIFGADALLLPLANNGGSTETHLPAAGSPAIGFGSTDLTIDQRGEDRPQGSQDDIGAVEVTLNGVVVDAGSGIGDGLDDAFLIVNDDQGITGDILVYVNSVHQYSLPKATTGQILVRGSSDDDTLTVDNSNGLIGAKMIFDGDGSSQVPNAEVPVAPGGLDTLRLIGTTPTTTTYNPGATVDAGAVYQEQNEIVQRVQFFGLEPIQVLGTGGGDTLNVASAPLGVGFPQALNGDNAINYSGGPNSGDPLDPVFAGDTTGLITVDGFESLEFAGFGTLNIDAGAGNDVINLNNPIAPTDLTAINVGGGDPTASQGDLVIVNGTAARDTIAVDQLTVNGATVTGAQGVVVNVTLAESLIINGQGDNDDFSITANDADEVDFTPDVFEDAGSFTISSDAFGPTQRLLPVSYRDLGAGGQIFVESSSGVRNLDFRIFGTDSGERFNVDATGRVRLRRGDSGFFVALPINANGAGELFLEGANGDDLFEIAGDHPFDSGVRIRGGSPGSGSDVLNFVGSGAGAVTLNLANQTITEAGFAAVSFAEIETVDLRANAALIVTGTNQNDTFDVTPTGAGNDGGLLHDGTSATFRYTNATSVTINGDSGSADQVNVHGNEVANTITTTADSITVDGSTVTLGSGLEVLQLFAGGGNDNVDLSSLVFAGGITILGGDGDDTLVGSPQVDHIFGGSGNDTLVGGGGSDFQYGEDGNDQFGNLTLTADGTPDDPGADQNFGGDGSDIFVWEPGDGADVNSGGDDGGDTFHLFGSDAADDITLQSGETETHFNAVFNANEIDNSGIENVLVDPLGGNDTILVQDLFATEVVSVTINVAGGDEAITVAGRSTADDLTVSVPLDTRVELGGLTYDVNILGSNTADDLTINAGDGGDSIDVTAGVEAILNTLLNGGAGDDSLSGNFNSADGGAGNDLLQGGSTDSTMLGGAGDDSIIGGSGNETIDGGSGQDSIIGGGGDDTIDGGADFDTILIEGTPGSDVIDVFQASPTELRQTVNGDAQVDTLVAETVEEARIIAGAGADLIRVNWLDAHGINAGIDALRMTVDGGSDATSDRLVVVDDGADDLVLYRKGQFDDSGTVQIGPGNAEPLLSVFSGIETINFVDEAGAPIVNDPAGPQLVVFKHDPFENNDDRLIATYLGGGATINVDPTIDPGALTDPFGDGFDLPGDRDFYRLIATKTGTLDFQVYFRQVGGAGQWSSWITGRWEPGHQRPRFAGQRDHRIW